MSELSKVNFNILRYANCWEDADVLLQSLQLPPQSNICCIASAGDNALALLSTHPAQVDAFDISPVQLYLTELKWAAFIALEHNELLRFLGVKPCIGDEKLWLLKRMLPILSLDCRKYWKAHPKLISNGLIHAGKFEHYFQLFRKWFLPMVHSKKAVQHLLKPKSGDEQKTFYNITWNNSRWHWLMCIFFSKKVMGRYGRDPQFLKQVQVPVNQFVREKATQHLQSVHCTNNAFLQMIFTGNYQQSLPFYLRRENFDAIKKNVSKLNIIQADASTIVKQKPYDAYCLSNIFEYMPQLQFEQLTNEWQQYILPGSKLAFWNLMAPRSFEETSPGSYKKIESDEGLLQKDNGFFYNRFCLEERTNRSAPQVRPLTGDK